MSLEKKVQERIGDPQEYYEKHYPGWTRKQLRRCHSQLAYKLSKTDYWAQVPEDFGDDLVAHFNEYYPTETRGTLKGINEPLYYHLRKNGLIDKIPRSTREDNFGEHPYAHYINNYAGLTRSQLHKANSGLYNRLRELDLLRLIPRVKTGRKPNSSYDPLKNDPWGYYVRHLKGTTRTQLRDTHYRLYKDLHANGSIENIPVIKQTGLAHRRSPRKKRRRLAPDPLTFYNTHYAGMTRGELLKVDKSLYSVLSEHGKLLDIPATKIRKPPYNPERYDPLDFYDRFFAGKTQNELKKLKPALYKTLKDEGFLDEIPTARLYEDSSGKNA